MRKDTIKLGRYAVELTRIDKIFFPGEGLTKGDVIGYYRRIVDTMLPHVQGRPLVMHRFPDGLSGEEFFQKDVPDYFPDWIHTVSLGKKKNGRITHVLCDNAATLIYLANQACLTPHVWLSRSRRWNHPDRMIFDLDPSGQEFRPVREAALALRSLLEEISLRPFSMTTGSRGLHVVVPLDRRADFDTVRSFARDVARVLAHRHPDRVTIEQRKTKRKGRLFVDTLRNAYAQTGVAPYAVRAKPGAPVAAPLEWREVENRSLHPRQYTMKNIFRRLGQKRDPWKEISRHARSLKEPRERLDRLITKARARTRTGRRTRS